MRTHPHHPRLSRSNAGFTLIEIMAVIGVIIILAGILIGITGTVMERGDRSKTQRMMKDIERVLDDKRAETGRFPADLSGMPDEIPKNPTTNLPIDVWKKEFKYVPAENRLSYSLASGGPDMSVGTLDDISNLNNND